MIIIKALLIYSIFTLTYQQKQATHSTLPSFPSPFQSPFIPKPTFIPQSLFIPQIPSQFIPSFPQIPSFPTFQQFPRTVISECILLSIKSINSMKIMKGNLIMIEYEYENRCKKNVFLPKHTISFELVNKQNKNILSILPIEVRPNAILDEISYKTFISKGKINIKSIKNEEIKVNSILKRTSNLITQSQVFLVSLIRMKIINLKSEIINEQEDEESFFTKDEERILDLSYKIFNLSK